MPLTLKGKQILVEAFETGILDIPTHIAWGSGSSSFTENDTILSDEFERNSISSVDRQSTTIEYTGTLTTIQGVGETIQEVGLFNDATSGDMWARDVLYPINKTNAFEYDTLFVLRVR